MFRPCGRLALVIALGAALLAGPAASLAAQEGTGSRFSGSAAVMNTQPLGELRTGPGFGLALSAAYALDANRIFRLRGEVRGGMYDHDSRELCLGGDIGCWIRLDLNTSYASLYGGLGPEIALPLGPMDLVLAATGGVGAFSVTSSLEGVDDNDSFGDTNHFQDSFFAWSAGGELRVPVSRKVAVALGSHYQHNGRASYVVEGGITERSDGTLAVTPITTDANMIAITLGVAVRP